ncbi:MAG TPA: flagellar protein FliS [Acidobacteriaceae bacterium]|nr:flagellar protein FliS [Acidobacteriaceae bacterium]
MKSSLRAYRMSAVEGATHIDVLLACYDALAEDLRLAGGAAGAGDFTARCRYSQHALVVLGHLQSWAPLLENETLEVSLAGFYEYLRKKLLCLQSCVEEDQFLALAMTVCETRAVWQKKKSLLLSSEIPIASEGQPAHSNSVEGPRLHCSA